MNHIQEHSAKLKTQEPDSPFKDPNEPTIPAPAIPEPSPDPADPYPVIDPIPDPNPDPQPFPKPPEPIPQYPPDVVF